MSVQKCFSPVKFYVLSWELVPLIRICILNTVFDFSPRVWRYRGGRDGHETLQQFMYFLGKPRMSEVTGQGSDKESEVIPSQPHKVYPGVVAFCLPELLENEPGQQHSSPDVSNLQVSTIMYMYVAVWSLSYRYSYDLQTKVLLSDLVRIYKCPKREIFLCL